MGECVEGGVDGERPEPQTVTCERIDTAVLLNVRRRKLRMRSARKNGGERRKRRKLKYEVEGQQQS